MDKYLNCFLSYNYNEELIENNLTRAFIVTLMGISSDTRNRFFSTLNSEFGRYDFSCAQFALQSNIEIDPSVCDNKYIVTLSSDTIIQCLDDFKRLDKEQIKSALVDKKPPSNADNILNELCGGSIPDAWIYDSQKEYCFLIECKQQGDFLYFPQIVRHAYKYYRWYDVEKIDTHTIKLTWYDVLEVIFNILATDSFVNEQEKFLMYNLVQYMGFFGYTWFKGFSFHDMVDHPNINISIEGDDKLFSFERLEEAIGFKVILPSNKSTNLKFLFNFPGINPRPEFNILEGGK